MKRYNVLFSTMKTFLVLFVLSLMFSALRAEGVASAAGTGITVRLVPSSCSSWGKVYLYAWTGSSNKLLGDWPGVEVGKDTAGWYSYIFADDVTSVNIIWNNGSGAQTKDITNVMQTTCYSLNAQSGNKIDVTIVDCSENVIVPENTKMPEELPRAELWYDFAGEGEKGVTFAWLEGKHEYVRYTYGMSKNFEVIDYFSALDVDGYFESKLDGYLHAIEDVNGDGKMDFSCANNPSFSYLASISDEEDYDTEWNKLINVNFDVNSDGRMDYLLHKGIEGHWSIMLQQADGSFEEQYMHMMTAEEYENIFDPSDPERWGNIVSKSSGRTRGNRGTVRIPAYMSQGLPRPPVYYDDAFMPTRTLDLNADGYMDIIDEERGVLCYNVGDGKWIRVDMGCSGIIIADLNGDDIQDFVYPGTKLCAVVYRGENNFETQVLYENLQVDQEMYCYDFDKDGDIDILVTFSAPLNSTGFAYTMFFENDGVGRFTQLDEQDYGENKLLFSNCQDLDGDGYYDMLAFRGKFRTNDYREVACSMEEVLEVVWLKGMPNKTFAQPEVLMSYSPEEAGYSSGDWFGNHNYVKINVADVDNDGYMEVWTSEEKESVALFTKMVDMAGSENRAPTAPAKPELRYDNGLLYISWGDGSDENTATGDLTYALRVGTTPGGDDILHAHANADGSRRNFLDGNMSKYHSYTLDLTQRQPCKVYVSVQAIDAQYMGSVWSEEASVEHTSVFADFSLSRDEVGVGIGITATALELPDGYTHTWTVEDGVCTGEGNVVEISFSAIGEKSITHMITAADASSVIAKEMVNVMPNYVDTADISGIMERSMEKMYVEENIYNPLNRLCADYNMDGYWDVIGAEVFVEGATSAVDAIFKGAENYEFICASGIWNTDLKFNKTFWYDWDHNGVADVLVETSHLASEAEYYYLPHNGTSNMQAKKSDENLATLLSPNFKEDYGYNRYEKALYVDFTHNGHFDVYVGTYDYISYAEGEKNYKNYLYTRQLDGSYQKEEIKGDFDNELLIKMLRYSDIEKFYVDVNRDGFTDVCALYYDIDNRTPYENLIVMLNKGKCEFEEFIIPFAKPLSSPSSVGGSDIYNAHLADMNNDGYIDIVANRGYDGAVYIMWNEANQRFSEPEILPLGDLDDFLFEDEVEYMDIHVGGTSIGTYTISAQIAIADIDNNGYLDVVSMQRDKSVSYTDYTGDEYSRGDYNEGYGPYVHYFGAEGVVQQGFLYKHSDLVVDVALREFNLFKMPNHKWSVWICGDDVNENRSGHQILPIRGTTNERPSVPEGVRAVQNAEGMLIEWSGAKDDFTPAVQMRYNLSVKKKGQTGAGAYIISPQNGANSNAAPVRNYDYITATQYLVPLTVLPEGEYEIQVQAIDLQGDWSDFSEPITIEIQRESVLDAPTVACKNREITLVYMGATTASTPEWDFDGAKVVSGTGYGPYVLSWDSVGTKTISVTIDGATEERMIYVEENGFEIDFSNVVVVDIPMTVNIPADMTVNYYLMGNDDEWHPMEEFNGSQVQKKGNTLIFHSFKDSDKYGLYFGIGLTNKNGCDTILKREVYVVGQEDMPEISLVTSNAEGRNVIRWEETSSYNFSEVRILKETNRYNQFVEVGVVPIGNGEFVDMSSNAAVKSERYVIEPVMGDVEIPMGTVHQTAHLTINRGMNDQTWNLIWNRYEGADVVSYNILRGASLDAMTTIATISSSYTSYTDFMPEASAPYYAIEYVLADDVNMTPQQRRNAARNLNSGRSNVVNSATANKIVYAEKIAVLSANNKYETTEEKAVLLLYAEIMPEATTYQQVIWEIVSGSELATIDQSGLLTARTPNKGGVVTVKATTMDGTSLSAARNITIGAIVVEEGPIYFSVSFMDWDGTILKTEQVEKGKSATAPANPVREGYTFIGWDTDFSNVQSDLLVKVLYEANGSVDPDDKVYFIVGFMDWNGTILKTEQVEIGKSATAPADPVREGYTFVGWDTDFSNVQSDLLVKVLYEANDPGKPDNDPITVRLNPNSAPTWSDVYLYAWTDQDGQFCGDWPGVKVSKEEGWWSYTFAKEISIANIIWNAGMGNEQTIDILNVTESTCYDLLYTATNIDVIEVDCVPITALDDVEEEPVLKPRKEMIDGILYIIMPDGTKYMITGAIVE